MPNELKDLWFSQASLSAWQTCPLKFKYRYIDGLYWPLTAEGKLYKHIERGREFHLLAQRYFSGGGASAPMESMLATWLARLQEYLPLSGGQYLPEYELRLIRGGFRLLAKYDLLVVSPAAVTIYDWKTDGRPPGPGLAASVQTRLYLSLLARSNYFADQETVEMVYWNPRFPQKPMTIVYSPQQLLKDEGWVAGLIGQIVDTADFPATTNEKKCRICEYRPICHGQGPVDIGDDLVGLQEVDWEQIQEVVLEGVNFP